MVGNPLSSNVMLSIWVKGETGNYDVCVFCYVTDSRRKDKTWDSVRGLLVFMRICCDGAVSSGGGAWQAHCSEMKHSLKILFLLPPSDKKCTHCFCDEALLYVWYNGDVTIALHVVGKATDLKPVQSFSVE